jgi:hypothetical protein
MIKQIKRFTGKKSKKAPSLGVYMLNQHLTIQLLILQINKVIHFFGLLLVEVVLRVRKKVHHSQLNQLQKKLVR